MSGLVTTTPSASPPTLEALLFPSSQLPTLSSTLHAHRSHTLSIPNRLASIAHDAAFVLRVASTYPYLPLIANERCGSWYIPPSRLASGGYWKSTDGHHGEWAFSTRRLNTHILKLIGDGQGTVVVDSTRRGKSMPDALSKTIPIWCAVWNRVLFPTRCAQHATFTPPRIVSKSEKAQMDARLDNWVEEVLMLDLDLDSLRKQIQRPMRPLWVTQDSALPDSAIERVFDDFYPIVCCTASRNFACGETAEGWYIQGAGDDAEGWSLGLTPAIYWANTELLHTTPAAELPVLIAQLIIASNSCEALPPKLVVSHSVIRVIPPTTTLFMLPIGDLASTLPTQSSSPSPILITISHLPSSTLPAPDSLLTTRSKISHIHLHVAPGKVGSRQLRTCLPSLRTFILSVLPCDSSLQTSIFIAHPAGDLDHAVGIALTILVLYYDEIGEQRWPSGDFDPGPVTKHILRKKLNWILQEYPQAKVARATLGSVNEVVMGRPQ